MIPDSGVLISLGKAKLLDLLLVFRDEVEIVITDVVEFEVTRRLDKDDAREIREFLTRNQARVQVDRTGFGPLLAKVRAGAEDLLPPDIGELSVYSYVRSARLENPGAPTLVLFEDDWFTSNAISVRPGIVHLLTTRAFIKGLEKLSPKSPANSALRRVLKNRQQAMLDSPALRIPAGSTWQPAVVEERVARVAKRLK